MSVDVLRFLLPLHRATREAQHTLVGMAGQAQQGYSHHMAPIHDPKNSAPEHNCPPFLYQSMPIRIFKQGILQVLFWKGTEKPFHNQHILIYKQGKEIKRRWHNMVYNSGDGKNISEGPESHPGTPCTVTTCASRFHRLPGTTKYDSNVTIINFKPVLFHKDLFQESYCRQKTQLRTIPGWEAQTGTARKEAMTYYLTKKVTQLPTSLYLELLWKLRFMKFEGTHL